MTASDTRQIVVAAINNAHEAYKAHMQEVAERNQPYLRMSYMQATAQIDALLYIGDAVSELTALLRQARDEHKRDA